MNMNTGGLPIQPLIKQSLALKVQRIALDDFETAVVNKARTVSDIRGTFVPLKEVERSCMITPRLALCNVDD